MLLGIPERILLLNHLPQAEGNAVFLRSVRRLRNSLSFSERELKDWNIVYGQNGQITFDPATKHEVEIDITGTVRQYVSEKLAKVEAAGKLPEELLPLYDELFPEE